MSMENEALLKNRLNELARRAEGRGQWVFSEFLTPAEQDVLLRLRVPCPFTLFGGLESSERRVACFGSERLTDTVVRLTDVRLSQINPAMDSRQKRYPTLSEISMSPSTSRRMPSAISDPKKSLCVRTSANFWLTGSSLMTHASG